jgi:hypothetical protein
MLASAQVGGTAGERRALEVTSQANSAGSIPVTRSTTKAQARDMIPNLGLDHF